MFKTKASRQQFEQLILRRAKYSIAYVESEKNKEIQRNAKPIWSSHKDHAEVRRTAVRGSQGTQWHQDGDTTTEDMDFGLVLWSQHNCTEFKFSDGTIIQAKPFEIIYIDNLSCYHRRPPEVEGKRWSFRQRVQKWRPKN